jgi:hypothetical protein
VCGLKSLRKVNRAQVERTDHALPSNPSVYQPWSSVGMSEWSRDVTREQLGGAENVVVVDWPGQIELREAWSDEGG